MVVPPEVMGELEARKQQIGQLNLLAAIVAYYSMTPYLAQREVMHFIDNTAAVAGIAKGFSWWHLELLSGGPVRCEGRAVGA